MATEPETTSACYNPLASYTPPVGRLPVLGKIRAEIDHIRATIVNDRNRTANEVLKIQAEIAALEIEADKLLVEKDRIAADILKINAEVVALGIEAQKLTAEKDRIIQEGLKIGAEITAMVAHTANENTRTANDTARLALEKAKIDAEVIALGIEADKLTAEKDRIVQEGFKIQAEITAIGTHSTNETQQTVNDTTRATNDTNKTNGELQALADKTAAEVSLLNQKTQTELANVADTVLSGTVTGLVGKQKDLFTKQAEGFDRDAEQKLSKILVDTWSVRMSTDQSVSPSSAGLAEEHIKSVLNVARTGINAGIV